MTIPAQTRSENGVETFSGRRRNWLLALLIGTLGLLVIACLVTVSALVFVYPQVDEPRRSAAIVSLAGSPLRLKKALELAHQGFSHRILLSVVPGQGEPCIASTKQIQVICFTPRPATTRGEARAAASLAAAHGWHRLIVVADISQVSRARLLFDRCTRAKLIVVGVSNRSSDLASVVAYEWAATIKALIWRGC